MKAWPKVALIFLLCFCTITLFAQTTSPEPDDDMSVFLMVIAALFFGAMLGAAIIGAFFATLTVLFVLLLCGLGIFSTALLVGLYKRSVSSGFKTLLLLFFCATNSFLGLISLLIFNQIVPLGISNVWLCVIGFSAGLLSGIFMGNVSFLFSKNFLQFLLRKRHFI